MLGVGGGESERAVVAEWRMRMPPCSGGIGLYLEGGTLELCQQLGCRRRRGVVDDPDASIVNRGVGLR